MRLQHRLAGLPISKTLSHKPFSICLSILSEKHETTETLSSIPIINLWQYDCDCVTFQIFHISTQKARHAESMNCKETPKEKAMLLVAVQYVSGPIYSLVLARIWKLSCTAKLCVNCSSCNLWSHNLTIKNNEENFIITSISNI